MLITFFSRRIQVEPLPSNADEYSDRKRQHSFSRASVDTELVSQASVSVLIVVIFFVESCAVAGHIDFFGLAADFNGMYTTFLVFVAIAVKTI